MNSEPEAMVVTLDTGDRLHYLDWRPAAPGTAQPLLLIHGLSQTAWSWAPVARRLAARHHVLAVDLRGHGLSDSPRTGYDLESLAYDVLTVLSATGYGADVGGPPAVVAGHGFGALVAATAATLNAASVAGLALVDAGWEAMADASGLHADEFVRTLGDPPEVLASMAAYLADRREYDPATWDLDQERAARAAVDEKHAGHVVPVTRAHALRGAVEAMFEYDPRAALSAWRGPLLIAVAESATADDETLRERRLALDEVLGQRAQARSNDGESDAPEPRVIRFGGAGHNLMRYRPDELADALSRLLDDALAYQRS